MKKNGFTLVELLAVLVIIGILSALIIPQVSKYLQKSTETVYESYKKAMKEAAKNYVMDNPELLNLMIVDEIHQTVYDVEKGKNVGETEIDPNILSISLNFLVKEGYMDQLEDPENKKNNCDGNSAVLIKKVSKKDYKYGIRLVCGDHKIEEVEIGES